MYNHDLDKQPLNLSFNGFYRGIVLNVDDPLQAGRIKIRVFSVYDDIPEDVIPWAEYADPFLSMGFFVPDVGDMLWVFFDNGNHMTPVYFAGASFLKYPFDEKVNPAAYPKNRIIKTDANHLIEIDDTPGGNRINIKHSSGTRITMMPDGSVDMVVKKDYRLTVDGDYIANIKGNHHETTQGNVSITSPRIDFN